MHSRRVTTPPTSAPDSLFSSYLSALPSWDRRLLQQVEILDAKALIEHLQTDQVLFVVSDGGADAECGSYGAVLTTVDAVVVKISGSTEGALPGSFRAESYGCLAILLDDEKPFGKGELCGRRTILGPINVIKLGFRPTIPARKG
jgi:hypothetical protein